MILILNKHDSWRVIKVNLFSLPLSFLIYSGEWALPLPQIKFKESPRSFWSHLVILIILWSFKSHSINLIIKVFSLITSNFELKLPTHPYTKETGKCHEPGFWWGWEGGEQRGPVYQHITTVYQHITFPSAHRQWPETRFYLVNFSPLCYKSSCIGQLKGGFWSHTTWVQVHILPVGP